MSTIRISKILKELNIGLDRAIETLAEKGHEIENNRHAKITDEQYQILLAEFKQYQTQKELSEQENQSLKVENYRDKSSNNVVVKSIALTNFRRFKELPKIELGGVTFFVGPNNSGKSTVVKAIQLIKNYLSQRDITSYDLSLLEDNYKNILNWKRLVHHGKEPVNDEVEITFESSGIRCNVLFTGEGLDTTIRVLNIKLLAGKYQLDVSITGNQWQVEFQEHSRSLTGISDNEIQLLSLNREISIQESELHLKKYELNRLSAKAKVLNEDNSDYKRKLSWKDNEDSQFHFEKLYDKVRQSKKFVEEQLTSTRLDENESAELRNIFKQLWREFRSIKSEQRSASGLLSVETLKPAVQKTLNFTDEVIGKREKLRPVAPFDPYGELDEFDWERAEYKYQEESQVYSNFRELIDFINKEADELDLILLRYGSDKSKAKNFTVNDKYRLTNEINSITKKLQDLKSKRNKLSHNQSLSKDEHNSFELDFIFQADPKDDNSLETLVQKIIDQNRKEYRNKKGGYKGDDTAARNALRQSSNDLRNSIQIHQKNLEETGIFRIGNHSGAQSVTYNIGGGLDPLAMAIHEYFSLKLAEDKDHPLNQFLNKWLRIFEVGDALRVIPLEGDAYQLKVVNGDAEVHLADKGKGSVQAVFILLNLLTVAERLRQDKKLNSALVMIEEPEVNLHPYLQSKLTDFFHEVNRDFGIQFIIETHSEYLVRRVRVVGIENNLFGLNSKNPFKVIFFGEDGPYDMGFQENGKFIERFEPGFYDHADDLEMEAFDKLNEN
jgi:predicted ATPase